MEKNSDKTLGDVLQVAVPSHPRPRQSGDKVDDRLRLRASFLRSFDVRSEKVVAGIGVENPGNRKTEV